MPSSRRLVLITGGAGFVGSNAAAFFLSRGWSVSLLDNLSRPGGRENLRWLLARGPVDVRHGDMRDRSGVERWVRGRAGVSFILHLAGQVAVTTSIDDPRMDFEINALGTLNLLEAARRLRRPPFFLYSSTNKVYGGMEGVRVRMKGSRYGYVGRPHGVGEEEPLDFHSPYGCSKGAADQYVRDYQRIYGLPTVVFRQSCIFGPHQHGNEDQGWVAHFLKAGLSGEGLTIYGDGRQVRDVLYIDDLLSAFDHAYRRRSAASGRIYNIGGGPRNTLSLLELVRWMARKAGRRVPVEFKPWRAGDQRVYVSDIRRARRELGWQPRVPAERGLDLLWDWLKAYCNKARRGLTS